MRQLTSTDIKTKAAELGFDACGVAPAGDLPELEFFQEWLARGYAGSMAYLERRPIAAPGRSVIPSSGRDRHRDCLQHRAPYSPSARFVDAPIAR